MKPLVPEQNTLESVMLIPIERKPRILLEKQSKKAQIERKPNWFDDELESMNLNSRTLLFKLTDRNAENVLEFLNELKPKLEGKRAYFLYSELFKFLIRINRLKILRELIAEYIGERMIYAANDPKLWLPIFTVLKALYRSGQGQRNHILPPQFTKLLRKNTVLIPKFYSLYIYAKTRTQNPDSNFMFRFLNEMALVQVPRLKDFNRCLAVATQSVIARPEANEILAKLLEKYQPNAETMVYVIRHQFKAKHRLLKRAFEKEEKTLVPLLNFIDTFTLLHKAPVQMALLENVLKFGDDKVSSILNLRSQLIERVVDLSPEFVNSSIRFIALEGDTEAAIRHLRSDLSPTFCFKNTINSVLHSIDPQNPLARKDSLNSENSREVWDYIKEQSLSLATLKKFIKVATLNGDINTLIGIQEYLQKMDSKSQQKLYPVLLEYACDPLVASPKLSLRFWKKSSLTNDDRSWKWLLGSIQTRSHLDSFQDIVVALLKEPIEEEGLKELISKVSQRIQDVPHEQLYETILEMKKLLK